MLFHHARERACVRQPAAFELVVQVGVRVDVKHRQPRMGTGMGPQHRVGDGVIAAEREHPGAAFHERVDGGLDFRQHGGTAGERDIADVGPS